jgi:hypothetical protein
MRPSSSTALTKQDQRIVKFRGLPEWQRIWLTLEAEHWKSLAVIPTGELECIELVHGLAAVAWQQRGARIIVADLRTIGLPTLAAAKAELRRHVDAGTRVMIATRSLDANPITAAIARDADRAVLCVHLGLASTSQISSAVRQLGRQRFLGAVMISQRNA